MDSPDLSRVSQLIPHVKSTIDSYQSVIQSGSELRDTTTFEYNGTLAELRDMLGMVIQQAMEHEDYDGLDEKLALHDQITDVIEKLQNPVNVQEKNEGIQDPFIEKKEEPIDTHEIIELIEKEEEDINVPQEDFECTICYMDTEANDGYMYSSCFHVFCKTCLEAYYNSNIMSGDVTNITCPHSSCDSPVLVQDIQRVVTPDVFQKYENFSVLSFLRADPSTRWCPHPGCNGAVTGDEDITGKVMCPTCQNDFCYDCSGLWHQGMTCSESNKSKEEEDPKTKKWKKKHGVKQCPHCGLDTIRMSGCPDMICSNCKKHWDWFYDEPDEWEGDGLRRKSETKLETAAFVYPRFVKLVAGSRDLHEGDDDGEGKIVVGIVAAMGIAGVPLTLICGGPALAIRGGRKLKNKWAKSSKSSD